MEQWLRCEASPGQFPGELAITGNTSSGAVFSLFMPESRVKCSKPPVEGQSVEAWLRVDVLDKREGFFVVQLPRQTMENGQFVTVKEDQLRQET
jgi:hypothetical protein